MKARRATLAATAALFALSVAACSGGPAASGPGTTQASNEPKAGSTQSAGLPTTDYTKLAYAQVKQGGTLTLAISQLPTNWNNNTADGQLADTSSMQSPMLGSAVNFAANGSYTNDTDYATIKVAKDKPTVIDVQINPKAVWSDGTPITAADMISYWKAQNGTNKKFNIASDTCFSDITSVKQVGKDVRHYTVTFDSAFAEWQACVWPDLPKAVTATPADYNTKYKSSMYPSDGPYIVGSVDQNGGVVTEVPNPKWWGRKPKLAKIVFRVVNQSGLGQAFANGEVNYIDTGAQVDVLKQAESKSGSKVERSGGLTYTQLTMNAQSAPLSDANVRDAIFYAINRQQFASVTQKGLGVPAVTIGSNILSPGQAGYVNTEDALYPYSKTKAEAALKASGYTITNGKAMKNGQQLTLSITVPSDTPTNAQRAQLVQTYLGQVGIKVNLHTVPSANYFSPPNVVTGKGKAFQMASFSWVGTPLPISGSESLFTPADSGQNFYGISTPQIGALYKKASETLDANARYAIFKQIDQDIYKEAVMVTFTPTPTIGVADGNLVNFGAVQFETTDWTQVGFSS